MAAEGSRNHPAQKSNEMIVEGHSLILASWDLNADVLQLFSPSNSQLHPYFGLTLCKQKKEFLLLLNNILQNKKMKQMVNQWLNWTRNVLISV